MALFERLTWYRYKLSSILFQGKDVNTPVGTFRMVTGTPNEVHRALTFDKKEPETLQWIDGFKPDEKGSLTLFDIGANVGIYTLYACLRHPSARIFSFEPDSQSFASLSRNIHLNKFGATPYPIALSSRSGLGTVNLSSMNAGAGACALGEQYRFTDTDQRDIFSQGIFFCTVDELVFKFGLPCPNYIKIDVDGIEEDILAGAKQVLQSPEFKGLLVEFQFKAPSDLGRAKQYLSEVGLHEAAQSDWVSSFGDLKSKNYIFLK